MKLVDSCYSFWVGGCFPLLQSLLLINFSYKNENNDEKFPELDETEYFFDQTSFQEYILLCAQDNKRGGFRDKPEK
jgi:protein farnesyltransferase subunit beta